MTGSILDGSTKCCLKNCGQPAIFRWITKTSRPVTKVNNIDLCKKHFEMTLKHNIELNYKVIDKKIEKFTEEFGFNDKHKLELRQQIIDQLLADRKTDKTDYAIIFKYCVACGKEKIFHCALVRGFYKGTVQLMKEGWICSDCSTDGCERFGDRLLLLALAKNIDLKLVKK